MEILGVALLITAVVVFIIVLIRAFKTFKAKEKKLDRNTLMLAGVASIFFIVAVVVMPETEYEKESNKKREEAAANAKAEEDAKNTYDITSESDIERLVNDLLGDTTNTDEKRVERVIYNELDDDHYIGLNLHANENVTNKLTRGGILKNSFEIMEALHEQGYAGKFYVDWRLPLTDSYGNTEAGKVLSIDITAEDFAKINYDDFLYENLPKIAESYFEHPGFSE